MVRPMVKKRQDREHDTMVRPMVKKRQNGERDTMVRTMVKKEAGRRALHNGLTNGEKRGRAESMTQWSD